MSSQRHDMLNAEDLLPLCNISLSLPHLFLTKTRPFQKNCKALSKFCRIVKLCFLAKVGSHFWPALSRPWRPQFCYQFDTAQSIKLAALNFATNLILALQPFTINHNRANRGPYKSHCAHVSLHLAVQPQIATNKPKK